jgi:Fe2+ or Zn2+ uptake regulation protein
MFQQARFKLQQAGINPSIQRLKIYELLHSSQNHPTVDSIHNQLVQIIPTLSKTTIYNTLNLFQQRGLVRRITIDENEVRYDADITPHAHFKCTMCERIIDVPVNSVSFAECMNCPHRINEEHIYLKGICRSCLE